MTVEEKDRCVEVLFYLYFTNLDDKLIGNASFWNVINNLCTLYNIDNIAISKAIRILLTPENTPSDEETYYLLNKLELTVRPINKISGVYWQKQIQFQEEFNKGKLPIIKRRIVDIVSKRSIRDFILALYNLFSIFNNIDKRLIDKQIFS